MRRGMMVALLFTEGLCAQTGPFRVTFPLAGGRMAPVTGRPVSGVEEQRSTQTLSDGTVISNSSSDRFSRDSAGRTRVDSDEEGKVTIVDPVAHVSYLLIADTKKARRFPMPPNGERAGATVELPAVIKSMTATFTNDGGEIRTNTMTSTGPTTIRMNAMNMKQEDLGVESLNGVLATHTRNTGTIPQGEIGNDRDIHVVNDRWYSDDLQMLVKTVNSDPRFGENTYEFTGISRDEPDPSLFQVPADYTIMDMGPERVRTEPKKQ